MTKTQRIAQIVKKMTLDEAQAFLGGLGNLVNGDLPLNNGVVVLLDWASKNQPPAD